MAEQTLKLFLRLRDYESEGIIPLDSRSICLQKNTDSRQYQLTGILQPADDQDKVYETVGKRAVQKFLEGYSSMFFLYGANETGKTYTLLGDASHSDDVVQVGGAGYKERGLIVRAMQQIFRKGKVQQKQKQFQVFCSCIEVSKVKIADLSRANSKIRLRIEQNRSGWFTAVNLHQNSITNMKQFVSYFKQILEQREFNNSHLIFQINLIQFDSLNKSQQPIQSYITFVELGFMMHTEELEEQQQMLIEINSLSHILNKITNLESIQNGFNESRLTKILKESICNSENITIIGTVGYTNTYSDNLETLNFLKTARDIDVVAQRTLSHKKRRSRKLISRRQSGNSEKDQILSYASSNTIRRKEEILTNNNGYDRTQYLLGEKQENEETIKELETTLEELKISNMEIDKKYRIKREELNHNIAALKYTSTQLKENQNLAIKTVLQKYQKFLEEQNTVTDSKNKTEKMLPTSQSNRIPSEHAMLENIKDDHKRAMKGLLDNRDQALVSLKIDHNKQVSNLHGRQHELSTKIDPFHESMYKQTLREIRELDNLIKSQEKYIRNMQTENVDQFKLMQILDQHKYKVKEYDNETEKVLREAKNITIGKADLFKQKMEDYLKSELFNINYKDRFKNSKIHGL